MRITIRSAFCVAAAIAFSSFKSEHVRADVLYSVTNLGQAAPAATTPNGSETPGYNIPPLYPNGNYLGALSQSQQAAFQSGSFDIYAHPATTYLYGLTFWPSPSGQGDTIVNSGMGSDSLIDVLLTTSNNTGQAAGLATESFDADSTIFEPHVVVFTSHPETLTQTDINEPREVQNPGYLNVYYTKSDDVYQQFHGTVAGINDHVELALNEYTYQTNGMSANAILTPHLLSGNSDISLGSLGGTNGAAYALNNANQVVGWSQIASGAQHAFLYSNGTMQDLNLLIPPASGITLTSAVGIDSAGEIVAFGTDASGQTNEYFLTPLESPVPEPSTLAFLAMTVAGLGLRHAHNRRVRSVRNS